MPTLTPPNTTTLVVPVVSPVNSSLPTGNLIQNPGAEVPLTLGIDWRVATGTWRIRLAVDDNRPRTGVFYFFAGEAEKAELFQDVDVSVFSAAIDSGAQSFQFEGYVRSANQSPPDSSRIIIEYRDVTNSSVLLTFDSGEITHISEWQKVSNTQIAAPGTRWIRIRLISTRYSGQNSDGYFDDLSLVALTQ